MAYGDYKFVPNTSYKPTLSNKTYSYRKSFKSSPINPSMFVLDASLWRKRDSHLDADAHPKNNLKPN